jgi:hypothetical protein
VPPTVEKWQPGESQPFWTTWDVVGLLAREKKCDELLEILDHHRSNIGGATSFLYE